jgi:anti-sigma factor RsiW
VRCDDLEPLIEAIADGSLQPDAETAAHMATCARCSAALERARTIESLLSLREVAVPPPTFTAAVMAQVGQERWRAERVIDLGFNLAIAAGILIIAAAGAGLAWSLGFLSITIDLDALLAMLDTQVADRVLSQVQTIAMAGVLLTMALLLWWWAETAAD